MAWESKERLRANLKECRKWRDKYREQRDDAIEDHHCELERHTETRETYEEREAALIKLGLVRGYTRPLGEFEYGSYRTKVDWDRIIKDAELLDLHNKNKEAKRAAKRIQEASSDR